MIGRRPSGRRRIALVLPLLSSLGLISGLCSGVAGAEEGLFRPAEINVPPVVRSALRSVVRVRNHVSFEVRVFPDPAALAALRAAGVGRPEKVFSQTGVVWPIEIVAKDLRALCTGVTRSQPGNSEICTAMGRASCQGDRCTFRTQELRGSATGFLIGRTRDGHALVLTAYHVAREAIERLQRTGGAMVRSSDDIPDLTVRPPGRVAAEHPVRLIANASRGDWTAGRDWAVLEVAGLRPTMTRLKIADLAPRVGDRVWVIGFPTRTERAVSPASGYQNASDELRISTGVVVRPPEVLSGGGTDDIYADVDGVAGNSGSPAVNARGEVVGLFRAHTDYVHGDDLRLTRFGGLAQLVPGAVLKAAISGAVATR